jgi:hypothetical protein
MGIFLNGQGIINQYQGEITVNIKGRRDRLTPQPVHVRERKTGRDCLSPLHKNRRGLQNNVTCNIYSQPEEDAL